MPGRQQERDSGEVIGTERRRKVKEGIEWRRYIARALVVREKTERDHCVQVIDFDGGLDDAGGASVGHVHLTMRHDDPSGPAATLQPKPE